MNHSTSVLLSPPILRGAFGHLKSELCIALSNQSGNQHNHGRNFEIEEVACVNSDKTQACYLIANSKPDIVKGYVGKEMGSYTCNLAIDPLWPLCMYELRGKCNNDECPWQHVKYFADRNKNLHDDSDSAGILTYSVIFSCAFLSSLSLCIFFFFCGGILNIMLVQVVRLDQQFLKNIVMLGQNFPRVTIF